MGTPRASREWLESCDSHRGALGGDHGSSCGRFSKPSCTATRHGGHVAGHCPPSRPTLRRAAHWRPPEFPVASMPLSPRTPLTWVEPWCSRPIHPTSGDSSLSIPGSPSKSPESPPPIRTWVPSYDISKSARHPVTNRRVGGSSDRHEDVQTVMLRGCLVNPKGGTKHSG
jgi:hypothetical protein